MKRWVIINVADAIESCMYQDCYVLSPDRRPKIVYEDKEQAERDLARLAGTCLGEFYLFQTIAFGAANKTCAGTVGRCDRLEEDYHRELMQALARRRLVARRAK